MRSRLFCPLIASLILSACAVSTKPPPLVLKPQLDQSLAADCKPIGQPVAPDYDEWPNWVVETVIPQYTECAIRHRRTVEAWPK